MEVENTKSLQLVHLSTSTMWHTRLGHVGLDTMKVMINKGLVDGIPKITIDKETCTSCLLGKKIRKMFPRATSFRATGILDLVHGDLCCPISLPTAVGHRYVFVLIDDHSRYMWTILLKDKSDVFLKFKRFKSLVEQETKATIKMFCTDRGGEFMSREFQSFCDNSGINRHFMAPYSPQHNGVVEKRNRTLLEMTQSLLKRMNVRNFLWGEAV